MYLRLTSLNAHRIKYLFLTNQLCVPGAAFPIGTLEGLYLSWFSRLDRFKMGPTQFE